MEKIPNDQPLERRYFHTSELRAIYDQKPRLIGHAAVFNQLSDDLGGFREQIAPGAFAETIKTADIRALWNHDPNFVLGRTKSRTLALEEDHVGLKIETHPPDTQFARDLMKSIDRGDVDQMSIGFRVMPQGDEWKMEDGGLIRTLRNLALYDVSPVTFPAYPQTDVSIRARAEEMRSKLGIISKPPEPSEEEIKARLERRRKLIERIEELIAKRRFEYVVEHR